MQQFKKYAISNAEDVKGGFGFNKSVDAALAIAPIDTSFNIDPNTFVDIDVSAIGDISFTNLGVSSGSGFVSVSFYGYASGSGVSSVSGSISAGVGG